MKKAEFSDIGKRLEKIRKVMGYNTRVAFARDIYDYEDKGNRYWNWESGGARIPVEYALRIKRLSGYGLDYIYDGDK